MHCLVPKNKTCLCHTIARDNLGQVQHYPLVATCGPIQCTIYQFALLQNKHLPCTVIGIKWNYKLQSVCSERNSAIAYVGSVT